MEGDRCFLCKKPIDKGNSLPGNEAFKPINELSEFKRLVRPEEKQQEMQLHEVPCAKALRKEITDSHSVVRKAAKGMVNNIRHAMSVAKREALFAITPLDEVAVIAATAFSVEATVYTFIGLNTNTIGWIGTIIVSSFIGLAAREAYCYLRGRTSLIKLFSIDVKEWVQRNILLHQGQE